MIASILTGRKGSQGFPEKHFCEIEGKALAYYPLIAAQECKDIDKKYISTDDDRLIKMAEDVGTEIIKRPDYLCGNTSLSEDVFIHAYEIIKENNPGEDIDILVLLMCNAPMVTSDIISQGIKVLQDNPGYDSAVTVSKYNMWSPIRARKIEEDGLLYPFIPFDIMDNLNVSSTSSRNSQGDVWFADMGVSIVRERCIKDIWNGILPQKWMGKKIFPLKQEAGLDVDYKWQISQVKEWLKLYGKK